MYGEPHRACPAVHGRDGGGGAAARGAVPPTTATDGRTARSSQQPKAADPYWVNPDGNAASRSPPTAKDGDDDERRADQEDRRAAGRRVDRPGRTRRPRREGFTEAAAKADRDALLVLYNIPHRDCGQFSKGGAADGDAYRAWLDKVAKGIGDRAATVILEPDALPHLVDGCTPQEFHEERYDLLKGAVEQAQAAAEHQGVPGRGQRRLVARPTRSSSRCSGRASTRRTASRVNVSNFQTTAASKDLRQAALREGRRQALRHRHQPQRQRPVHGRRPEGDLVQPAGPGAGRGADDEDRATRWSTRICGSSGRASRTATCKGGPKAGEWWPEYALEALAPRRRK